MAQTPAKSPGTITDIGGGDFAWEDPGNIAASDDAYAIGEFNLVTPDSNVLLITNFGFAIPAGATIDGIVVQIERKQHSSVYTVKDKTVQLTFDGTSRGDNKASGTNWPATDTVATYGGSSDDWSTGATYEEINDSSFGIVFKATGVGFSLAYIDHVTITVYYTEGVAIAASAQSLTLSTPASTVTTTRSVAVAVSALALALSLPAATVSILIKTDFASGGYYGGFAYGQIPWSGMVASSSEGVQISVQAQGLTLSIPPASVNAVRNVQIAPDGLSLTLSVPAATAAVSDDFQADTQLLTLSLPQPTVQASIGVAISPNAQSLTASVPQAAVSAQRQVAVAVEAQSLTLSVPAATVDIDTGATILASPQVLTLSVPPPAVSGAANVAAGVQSLTASVPAAQVAVHTQQAAPAMALTASVPEATVTAIRNVSFAAQVQTLTLSIPAYLLPMWGPVPRTSDDDWSLRGRTSDDGFSQVTRSEEGDWTLINRNM